MVSNFRNAAKAFNSSISIECKPQLMSQVFCYPEAIPKEKSSVSSCKSLKLMLSKGLVKHVSPGMFSLMSLGHRAFEKLCNLVDYSMKSINGQRVLFPTSVQESLMKKSGRWEGNKNLFKFKDRNSLSYCLGATHEEIATYIMTKVNISYKYLPLLLYQVSSKFRDEMNPKLGLLRGREFIMKDMYTFDSSEENARNTYNTVCDAYNKFFHLLGIKTFRVRGSSGDIGGDTSHEFHFPSEIGEDEILYCSKCKEGINAELQEAQSANCKTCNLPLERFSAIEVGHAFLLGTTYSEPFHAKFDSSGLTLELLQMGCYGLGLTRILAASIEVLSDGDNIRWPLAIAPYCLTVIPPKKGSKEESVSPFADSLAVSLNGIDGLRTNVLVDDRTTLTIGKRVQEASGLGIPYVVVVGRKALEEVPQLEVIDVYRDQTEFLSHKDTIALLRSKFTMQEFCQ